MICLVDRFLVSSQHPFLFVFLQTNITFKLRILTMMLVYMIVQTSFGQECFFTGVTPVFLSLIKPHVSVEVELQRTPVQRGEGTDGAPEDFSLSMHRFDVSLQQILSPKYFLTIPTLPRIIRTVSSHMSLEHNCAGKFLLANVTTEVSLTVNVSHMNS